MLDDMKFIKTPVPKYRLYPVGHKWLGRLESADENKIFSFSAALSGDRVNLKYIERYIKVSWRGETKYFAVGVERSANSQDNKEEDERFPRR